MQPWLEGLSLVLSEGGGYFLFEKLNQNMDNHSNNIVYQLHFVLFQTFPHVPIVRCYDKNVDLKKFLVWHSSVLISEFSTAAGLSGDRQLNKYYWFFVILYNQTF